MATPGASRIQAAWLQRGLLAWLLLPLSALYAAVVAVRRVCFRAGLLRSQRLPVPVVVVGNLIAGGAGKTPTAIALVRLLQSQGWHPGIVSRGYGRKGHAPMLVDPTSTAAQVGDEPLLMRLRTQVPVAVGADRVAAGRLLLQAHPEIDLIVCDDGLQHLRLARDAQVIVFDERGVGNGWLLPAGPLREPLPATMPPRSVVVYNAPSPSTPLAGHLAQRRLQGVTPLSDWRAGAEPGAASFTALRGRPMLAAAGVAWPQRFFGMLRAQGLTVHELPLPDHYDYAALPWPADTREVIVTEKDAVKLRPDAMGTTRVWVATLDFDLGPAIATALAQWLPTRANP